MFRAAHKSGVMASYNAPRKAREAAAQRRAYVADSPANWAAWISILLASAGACATLTADRFIMVAAMAAVGGIALMSIIVGVVVRDRDPMIHARIWKAAIAAIGIVFVVGVLAQFWALGLLETLGRPM